MATSARQTGFRPWWANDELFTHDTHDAGDPSATRVAGKAGVWACPAISDKVIGVRPACDGLVMTDSLQLRGTELRYVLTMHLFNLGPATITELAGGLAWHGFGVAGRTSKAISDALRWEMRYGRVRRLGRGRYGPGWMPRGTEHRIHKRVLELRDLASSRSEAGNSTYPDLLETPGAPEADEYPKAGPVRSFRCA